MSEHLTKTKLILVLSIILTLAFLFTSMAGYLVSKGSFREQSLSETLPLISNNIYSEIQGDIMRPVHVSSLMANDTFLKDWALAGEVNPALGIKYLCAIKDRYRFFTTFFVSHKTRKYYSYKGIHKTISPDDDHDVWYFNFIETRKPYDLDVDSDEAHQGKLTIFINHRVLDYQGDLLGVTGVGLNLDQVGRILASYQSKYQRVVYMVDSKGLVQIHPNRALILKATLAQLVGDAGLAQQMLSHKHGSVTHETDRKGKHVLLATRYFDDFDWFVVVEQDEGTTLSGIRSTLFTNLGLGLLVTVFTIAVVVLVVNRFQAQLQIMATMDDLTKVANRRHFLARLQHETARTARHQRPLSLLMIDADHFKAVNDRFGHDVGDQALAHLAGVLKKSLREVDVVGRLGGEEFAALLPETLPEAAKRAAQRLLQEVADSHFQPSDADRIKLTVSIGVAWLEAGESGAKDLLKRADMAMYRAKAAGRNAIAVDGEK